MRRLFFSLFFLFSFSVQGQIPYLHSLRSSDLDIQNSIDKNLSKFGVRSIELIEAKKYSELIELFYRLDKRFNEGAGNEEKLSWEIYSIYETKKNLEHELNVFVSIYPEHYLPYFLRGAFYVGQGWIRRGGNYYNATTKEKIRGMEFFHGKAINDINKALALNPDFMHSYLMRASIYRPKGKKELMWKDLRFALSLKEASFDAWTEYLKASMPRWYGSKSILENRLVDSQKLTHLNPRLKGMKAFVARNEAEKYWYAGKRNNAIKAYIAADRLGDHWWVAGEVARVLLDTGVDNDLACKYVDRAIKLEPYSIRNNRFLLYCDKNRRLGLIKE